MVPIFKFLSVYILPLSILIPVIAGIIRYKYLSLPLKVIFYLMIIYAIMNGVNSVLGSQHKWNNLSNDVLILMDFPMISVFYSMILSKQWKTPILVIAATYVVFWIADLLFIESIKGIYIYPAIFESIFIMLYAIVYMNQQTAANIDKSWSENSYNWINSGLLIYFASTLLMFTFYNTMLKMNLNVTVWIVLWSINDAALITELVLFAIAFKKCTR
jgi:hypothetical protein